MSDRQLVVFAGYLFDGSGKTPEKDVVIEVLDGCISGITRAAGSGMRESGDVLDLSDCCVLPPFVDVHVHLTMSGTLDHQVRKKQINADYEYFEPIIANHLDDLLNHGVGAVRDGGDRIGAVLRYRQCLGEQDDRFQSIKCSGRAWHRNGRYGALIGRAVAEDELLHEAMKKDPEPSDQVKLVNSGLNSLEEFARETNPQFSSVELGEAVRIAESKRQKVMVHANGRLPVIMAVKAGCHSIEHGFFMGRENLRLLAESSTCWVPTVFTMKAYLEGVRSGLVKGSAAVLEKNIEHQIQQLKTARKEGVVVAVGTDSGSSGVYHGASFASELRLFSEAGYSTQEIIKCATANGAELLGISAGGSLIERGKPADFIAVRGGSENLLENSESIAHMYMHGARVL